MEVHELIRRYLRRRRISQDVAAIKAGCSRPNLTNYLNGNHDTKSKYVLELLSLMGIDVAEEIMKRHSSWINAGSEKSEPSKSQPIDG